LVGLSFFIIVLAASGTYLIVIGVVYLLLLLFQDDLDLSILILIKKLLFVFIWVVERDLFILKQLLPLRVGGLEHSVYFIS
jgi:hypothetical protein